MDASKNITKNQNTIKLKKLNKHKYLILNSKGKKFNITLTNVFLKFGIEEYNSNYILNIFIKKNDDNSNYNKLIKIINIISKIERLSNDELRAVRYNIHNKKYISPIIDNKFDKNCVILRTYVDYNCAINIANIFMPLDKSTDISNYNSNINITVQTMWNTDTNYGVTIYTNKIFLLEKVSKNKK
jgi:hypothetical protein